MMRAPWMERSCWTSSPNSAVLLKNPWELVLPLPPTDLQPRRGSQAETAFTSSLAVRSKHVYVCVCVCVCLCVCARTHLCLTLCDPMEPHQVPLSMRFSRQEYWSRLSFPTPGDLLDRGIKPTSLVSPALAGGFFTTAPPGKPVTRFSPMNCEQEQWWVKLPGSNSTHIHPLLSLPLFWELRWQWQEWFRKTHTKDASSGSWMTEWSKPLLTLRPCPYPGPLVISLAALGLICSTLDICCIKRDLSSWCKGAGLAASGQVRP